MINNIIVDDILQEMSGILSCSQLKSLRSVLEIKMSQTNCPSISNEYLVSSYIQAKKIEGRSEKTLNYYQATIDALLQKYDMPLCQITSANLREYLNDYQESRGSSNVTIDNIRRIFSSFFSWLEDEEYIVKSPVRRIHKVKAPEVVKETISDEELEKLREACECERDLAIVDMLASTGIRVGELVNLNIADINLTERECIVTGKGNKQRKAYFDVRTKLHLEKYLNSRKDDNPALFVSIVGSHKRLQIAGVESRLKQIASKLSLSKIHPHKFRRTLATNAIDKGMPIEQVQKLLGHARIDTTMHYALVSQNNVKMSHRKYIG